MLCSQKFSILDVSDGDKEQEQPDLGKPLLGNPVAVDLTYTPCGDGNRVHLSITMRQS